VTGALALAVPAGRLKDGVVLAGESDKSGPIGLAVILVLGVLSYLLFKSMSKHLRKVREEFPADGQSSAGPDVGRTNLATAIPTTTAPATPVTSPTAIPPTATTPEARAAAEEHPPAEQGPDESG
jgi:hypothetical protein